MGGQQDKSNVDAIARLVNGLQAAVKTFGATGADGQPYIVREDWFAKDYQSQATPTIVVVPKGSHFELPIDNNEKYYGVRMLYTEVQDFEIHLWGPTYDDLYYLKSFVMTVTASVFKGWFVFDRFENELSDQNCQGKFGILYCSTKALIPQYVAPYGLTEITSEQGIPDSPPIKKQ